MMVNLHYQFWNNSNFYLTRGSLLKLTVIKYTIYVLRHFNIQYMN